MEGAHALTVSQWHPSGFVPHGAFVNFSNLYPADTNCTYGIRWIWIVMGQCVMNTRGVIALLLGFICLILWITTGIPQIVENFRSGLADRAISPLFLLCWLVGDVSNLIGCILTHQLILQIVIAVYSIGNDLVLCGQFVYCKLRQRLFFRRLNQNLGNRRIPSSGNLLDNLSQSDIPAVSTAAFNSSTQRLAVCVLGIINLGLLKNYVQLFNLASYESNYQLTSESRPNFVSRHLLQLTAVRIPDTSSSTYYFLDGDEAKLGYVFGWISTCMYLCSRFPQIYINWKRKSTQGLCVHMFVMTVMGNTSYGSQIFFACTERNYLLRAVPWIIGSWGVVALDFTILAQFYFYRVKTPNENNSQINERVSVLDADNGDIDDDDDDVVVDCRATTNLV